MKQIILITVLVIAGSVCRLNAQNRLYVKAQGGNDSNNGLSWETAVWSLDKALSQAEGNTAISEIWVAEGVYVPSLKAGNGIYDRDRAFVLPPHVKIYGGFTGGETSINERVKTNTAGSNGKSILSGIIGNTGTIDDTVCHVVIMASIQLRDTFFLDGFTITGGNADGDYNVKVNECKICHNENSVWHDGAGGGIFVSGTAMLSNNTITGNRSEFGGGIYSRGTITLSNSVCSNNSVTRCGGGIYTEGEICVYGICTHGTITLTDNRFSYNSGDAGAGIHAGGTIITLNNNTLNNNTTSNNFNVDICGGTIAVFGGTATLSNNTISDNTNSIHPYDNRSCGGIYAQGSIIMNNNIITNNTSNWRILTYGSTTLNNNTFSYNSDGIYAHGYVTMHKNTITHNGGGLNLYDHGGDSIILTNNTITNNQNCGIDALAYNNYSLTINNNIIAENSGGGISVSIEGDDNTVNIKNNTITHNTSYSIEGGGGGISINSWNTSNNSLTLVNNTITRNSAVHGGGIHITDHLIGFSYIGLINNIITHNVATIGGGVCINSLLNPNYGGKKRNIALINNTITSCTSGGIYAILELSNACMFSLYNNIVWDNSGNDLDVAGNNYVDSTLRIKNNLLGKLHSNMRMDSANNLFNEDPLFVNTDREDYHLMAGSPVINRGNNQFLPAGITTDIAGKPRIFDGIVDLGAYEYNNTEIKENQLASVLVYPNPAQSQFTVTNTENADIQLFNTLRQKVLQTRNTGENTVIHTDFLPQGLYVLKVVGENFSTVHKVQIVR